MIDTQIEYNKEDFPFLSKKRKRINERINLSWRAYNVLCQITKNKIITTYDVLECLKGKTYEEIRKLKGCGDKTYEELMKFVKKELNN